MWKKPAFIDLRLGLGSDPVHFQPLIALPAIRAGIFV